MEKEIIGYAPVDSGQLLLIDPCYLGDWKDGEYEDKKSHYRQVSDITLNKKQGGEILVSSIAGNGVAFGTGYGDGNYPVEAIYKEGRIKEIRIKFF